MSRIYKISMTDLNGAVSFGGGGGGRDSNVNRRSRDVVNNYGATMGALGNGVMGAGGGGAVAGPPGAVIGGAVGAAVGGIVGSISHGYAEDRASRRR